MKSQYTVLKNKQMVGSVVALKAAIETSLLFWSFAYLKNWTNKSVRRAAVFNNHITKLFSKQIRKGFSSLVIFGGSVVS